MIQLHTSLSLCLHLVLRQNPILDKPCFLLSPGPHVGSQVLPEKKTRQSTPGVLLTQDTYSAVLPVNQHSRSNHSLILLNDHFKSYVLSRTSLVLQWLKLCISNAGGHGFDAWSENWDPVCLAEWSKKKTWVLSFQLPFSWWVLLLFQWVNWTYQGELSQSSPNFSPLQWKFLPPPVTDSSTCAM